MLPEFTLHKVLPPWRDSPSSWPWCHGYQCAPTWSTHSFLQTWTTTASKFAIWSLAIALSVLVFTEASTPHRSSPHRSSLSPWSGRSASSSLLFHFPDKHSLRALCQPLLSWLSTRISSLQCLTSYASVAITCLDLHATNPASADLSFSIACKTASHTWLCLDIYPPSSPFYQSTSFAGPEGPRNVVTT